MASGANTREKFAASQVYPSVGFVNLCGFERPCRIAPLQTLYVAASPFLVGTFVAAVLPAIVAAKGGTGFEVAPLQTVCVAASPFLVGFFGAAPALVAAKGGTGFEVALHAVNL